MTSPPASVTACAVSWIAALLSPMTSFAPSAAKRSALARPMPDPAPVMIAILPLNAPMILPSARSIAAVDDDCLAGGEAARRARQEHRGAREPARPADAAQRARTGLLQGKRW